MNVSALLSFISRVSIVHFRRGSQCMYAASRCNCQAKPHASRIACQVPAALRPGRKIMFKEPAFQHFGDWRERLRFIGALENQGPESLGEAPATANSPIAARSQELAEGLLEVERSPLRVST